MTAILRHLALVALLAVALWLRVTDGGSPYHGMDELQVQAHALDALPSGRLGDALGRFEHAGVGNPGRLVAYSLSALQPVLVLVAALLFDRLSIPITESAWMLVSALPGALTVIAVYALVRAIAGAASGLAAAALLAVTPLHVLVSRSLAAAWAPAFLLETLAVLALRRVVEGRPLARPMLGATLGLYVLAHNQFPSLLPVLVAAALAFDAGSHAGRVHIGRASRHLRSPWIWGPPLAAAGVLVAMHVTFDLLYPVQYRYHGRGVGVLGHMIHRGVEVSVHPLAVAQAARAGLGEPFLAALLAGVLAWCAGAGRSAKTCVLAVWSLAYTAPFLFLLAPERTNFRGYLGDGLYALVLLLGVVVGAGWEAGGVRRGAALLALGGLLPAAAWTSWSTIEQDASPGWLRLPGFHGSRRPDEGVKAVGAWLRDRARPDARVFALGLDPRLVRYYAGRHSTGVVHGSIDEALACLGRAREQIDYVVVPSRLASRLAAVPGLAVAATMVEEERDVLLVLAGRPPAERERIELAVANRRFDRWHARLDALAPLADYEACDASPGRASAVSRAPGHP